MYTIKDFLSIDQLYGIKLKAGAKGLSRVIRTATIMDIPDIIDWVNKGVLVVSGVLFEQCFSKEMVDAFFNKGIAGIVTKEKFTNSVNQDILDYCDEIGFPIVTVPQNYSWEQIISPVLDAIIRVPYQIIEESQRLHYILIHSMINGVSLPDICAKFYELTNINHAILDSDFYIIGSSDNAFWKPCTKKINTDKLRPADVYMQHIDNSCVQTYCYQSSLFNDLHQKLFFYPIILGHVKYGYIVTILDNDVKNISANDAMKIQQLGLIIALHVVNLRSIIDATRRFNNLLLEQLLIEDYLIPQRAEELLSLTGKKLHSQYYAIHFVYKKLEDVDSLVKLNSKINRFYDSLEDQIENSEHIIWFEKKHAQIFLVPQSTATDNMVITMKDLFISTTKVSSVYVGVSEQTPLHFIKKAFNQSERVANFLMMIESKIPYYKYQDLGILKFFIEKDGKLADDFVKEIYESIIIPLINYDQEHHSQLLKTLTTYIENDCSKTKTEKQLFIHKNTLIARFNVINKLLNCNLSSSEDFFNIQLALKIHQALTMAKIV